MVIRLALSGLAAIFAIGAWLIAAPFVLRYQPAGAPWTGAARMDVAVGAILALADNMGGTAASATGGDQVDEKESEDDRFGADRDQIPAPDRVTLLFCDR